MGITALISSVVVVNLKDTKKEIKEGRE